MGRSRGGQLFLRAYLRVGVLCKGLPDVYCVTMSTPYENPDPERSDSTPPAGGSRSGDNAPDQQPEPQQPGTGYPPPGYQAPPPGYQAPPPGYGQPGQPPNYQTPPYPSPQGPPAYQQSGAYPDAYRSPRKSPAGDFRNLPQRLRNVTGIPKQVKNAYLLFLAGAALNLLASLINIVLTGSQYSAVRTGASVVGFIFAIIFAAIWVWFALLMKEGVGWARIVLIVLAALSVISGLVSLVGTLFLGTSLINLLASIAFVAGGVMLLLPGSVAYFNARRAQRFS
jgi:heme/copper-type cytochrome/quinol oxidase subunit 4